jgi:hypothetical protein
MNVISNNIVMDDRRHVIRSRRVIGIRCIGHRHLTMPPHPVVGRLPSGKSRFARWAFLREPSGLLGLFITVEDPRNRVCGAMRRLACCKSACSPDPFTCKCAMS